jgi:hypothetical protein
VLETLMNSASERHITIIMARPIVPRINTVRCGEWAVLQSRHARLYARWQSVLYTPAGAPTFKPLQISFSLTYCAIYALSGPRCRRGAVLSTQWIGITVPSA